MYSNVGAIAPFLPMSSTVRRRVYTSYGDEPKRVLLDQLADEERLMDTSVSLLA